MAINIHSRSGMSLAARFTTRLPRKVAPFANQSQLLELIRKDRSDIERQLRQVEWLMHHPHRGMSPSPRLLDDWRGFLSWVDDAIQHLEQPRLFPELEDLIRTWQDRRGKIVAPTLRWRRRADVIAV